MLQVTPKHKVFIAVQSIDFRKGLDSIIALCKKQLQIAPMTGHFFVFRNRKGCAIKILVYDSQGYWLCHKRLSTGSFNKVWPKSPAAVLAMTPAQLQVLIYNGDPQHVAIAPVWKQID